MHSMSASLAGCPRAGKTVSYSQGAVLCGLSGWTRTQVALDHKQMRRRAGLSVQGFAVFSESLVGSSGGSDRPHDHLPVRVVVALQDKAI